MEPVAVNQTEKIQGGSFGGIPVNEQPSGGSFGGVPVNEEQEIVKPEEPQGFSERVNERLVGRAAEGLKTILDYKKGDVSSHQVLPQLLGKVGAGGILDVIGEGIVSTANGISEVTPNSIKKPIVDAVSDAWDYISKSDAGVKIGEALEGGMEKWKEFSAENPQEAKTIESVANIGLLLAPAKVKANAKPNVLGKTAGYLDKKAADQIAKNRAKFVGDLISPKKTPAVKIEETARTVEKGAGPFKRSAVQLSKREKEIADEVSRITVVTPGKSIQGNLNSIVAENKKLATKLEADVAKYRTMIVGSHKAIDDAVNKLIAENPVIVGNAKATAEKVANKAKQIIDSNPSTTSGLLKSRKELDDWVRSQKGSKAFDPEMENALSHSVRTVRTAINDKLNASVASTEVKKELRRQSLLYDAIENLAPKAAAESNYAVGRLLQNIAKVLPWRRSFQTDIGALIGLGVIGSSETLAPIFAGGLAVSAVGMGTYKAVISPQVKKSLSSLVKATDRALLTSKNPSMIKQLRADRALILEIINNAEVKEPEEDPNNK